MSAVRIIPCGAVATLSGARFDDLAAGVEEVSAHGTYANASAGCWAKVASVACGRRHHQPSVARCSTAH